ncbi:hypothetical protein EV561_109160 [Rhizobium sp. BK376]|nr:hypothetical protein EV561_109160 [Rhizobium sp. BK376]
MRPDVVDVLRVTCLVPFYSKDPGAEGMRASCELCGTVPIIPATASRS